MPHVREAAVAGTWYPGTKARLVQSVEDHLAHVSDQNPACPVALIAPHAGLMYSGPVAAYAYKPVQNCSYAAIVMVGPSHFVGFRGVAVWSRGMWQSPLGDVSIASTLADAIRRASSDIVEDVEPHLREHSLEMQLPFVAHLLPDVPIVPMLMGYQTRATAEMLGDALARVISGRPAEERPVLLVASSDLSHYEDAATAARLDGVVINHVEAFDADALMGLLEQEPRHACGGGPMVSVLRAAKLLGASRARVLRYADSGDVSGDKSSVVGYMAAGIW